MGLVQSHCDYWLFSGVRLEPWDVLQKSWWNCQGCQRSTSSLKIADSQYLSSSHCPAKKKYTISKGMQLTQPCQGFGAWKVIGNDLFLQNTLHKKERQVFTHWCNPQITIWRTKATRCRLKLPNLPPNLDHLAWSNERFIRTQAVGKDLISEKLAGCGRSGLPNF